MAATATSLFCFGNLGRHGPTHAAETSDDEANTQSRYLDHFPPPGQSGVLTTACLSAIYPSRCQKQGNVRRCISRARRVGGLVGWVIGAIVWLWQGPLLGAATLASLALLKRARDGRTRVPAPGHPVSMVPQRRIELPALTSSECEGSPPVTADPPSFALPEWPPKSEDEQPVLLTRRKPVQ